MKTLQNRLLLLLALPILFVYGIVAVVQLRVESGNAARQAEILMGENVAYHAALCDMVFTSAAESAHGLANFIEIANPDSTEKVTAYIKAILEKHPVIVGSAVAYEPNQFPGRETRYAPYLYKPDTADDIGEMVGDFRYKDLAFEDYTHYDWYSAPLLAKKPVWSEPYLDVAGAGSLMCTYSVPTFASNGELKYITTIDISLDSIREIVTQGNTQHAECILFSAKGMVIASHSADYKTEWEMKATASSLLADWRISDTENIVAAIRGGQTGSRRVHSSRLGEDIFFSFAPLPASDWSLLVTMHEHDITGQVYKKVFTSMAIFFAGIVVLIVVIRFMVVQTGFIFRQEVDQAAAESQREHEAFVKDVFTSIQDGIFVIDQNYTILRSNQTFNDMYPEFLPLIGKKCWETSCLDTVCDDCPAEEMFRSGKLELSVHYEAPTETKKGMWLEHFSYPIFGDNREVVGAINFIRDVTQRKEMETKIQQYQTELENLVAERTSKLNWSELRMQAVLAGNAAIVFYGPDGIIETINPAAEYLTGYTESELVGQSVMGLCREDTRQAMDDLLKEFVARNEVTAPRLEISAVNKDGYPLWCDCSLTGIYDAAGKLAQLVIVCMDVTEKHSLVDNLEIAKQIAEQSTRAKSDFLANMSHEIRTPMNAIRGMTHLCLQTELTNKQREYLEKAQSATNNLLRIIDDILDFSKIEAGKLVIEKIPFRLSDSLGEVTDVVTIAAQSKGLTLETVVGESVPSDLVGDPFRLQQVLLNLAGNAVKFTEKGSVIIIVECVESVDESVWLSFTVRDTGIGMNDEQMQRLFTSFNQADTSTTRKYGGTGLGLAISRNLVELMGGKINVTSVVGEGTSFHFTLPFTVSETTSQESKSESESITKFCDLTGKRILLAEDNKINQMVARGLLETYGVELTIASDGAEAVELVKKQDFDLILMDIQMPNLDGIEATKAIRELDKPGIDKLPILAMTAHAMDTDHQKSLDAGMNDHLTKPIDPEKLRKALMKWVRVSG